MSIIHLGDCYPWLRTLPDNSVHAVVVDPPYGLSAPPDISVVLDAWLSGKSYNHRSSGFMGSDWDSFVPGPHVWREVFRVLRPGGHLVAFAGTRTVDLMGIAIRLGGFEVRDVISWCYWNGMIKGQNISKAIDKAAGATRKVVGQGPYAARRPNGVQTEVYGMSMATPGHALTAPATEDAKTWDGWATLIKPAVEPAILARKPISESTIAKNVLRWGTGGLNIRASKFAPGDPMWPGPGTDSWASHPGTGGGVVLNSGLGGYESPQSRSDGRVPANLLYCKKASRPERERGCEGLPTKSGFDAVKRKEGAKGTLNAMAGAGRTAGAIRNFHPTVKPVKIMRYLCRLVTPPGGVVLDPFMGSGSCGIAATLEGFDYQGAEIDPDFHAIAASRIGHAARWPTSWASTKPGALEKADDIVEVLEKAGQLGMF